MKVYLSDADAYGQRKFGEVHSVHDLRDLVQDIQRSGVNGTNVTKVFYTYFDDGHDSIEPTSAGVRITYVLDKPDPPEVDKSVG